MCSCPLSLSLFQNVIDLSDPKARDQFLATQFEMANQKMMEGKGYYYKCKIKQGSIPNFSMKVFMYEAQLLLQWVNLWYNTTVFWNYDFYLLFFLSFIGDMEASISHFINFIQFSSNPKVALATLQQILPPALFKAIIETFAAVVKAKVPEPV